MLKKLRNRRLKVKKMKKGMENAEERGITLIALIVTIIVLLILAGVTIATLMGDNGIITKANEAKTETEKAEEDELRKMTALEASTNKENKEYEDNNGDKAIIPAGFAVSKVEGENTIKDGLVIIDENENEFIWVPVDNYSEFIRREGYEAGGTLQNHLVHCEEADENGINKQYTETITTQKEAQEMYASVKKNKGFYIGRYEAGKGKNGNAVVRKGADVYNNVRWSKNGQMNEESTNIYPGIDETTDGAIELARNFDKINNYTRVTSTLTYGVQWDSIIKGMDSIENPNVQGKKYIQVSTGMGWYMDNYSTSNPLHLTGIDIGSNKSNCVKNIYDLAGNVYEWTMESYDAYSRVPRGGDYEGKGENRPASNRGYNIPSTDSYTIRFSNCFIYQLNKDCFKITM